MQKVKIHILRLVRGRVDVRVDDGERPHQDPRAYSARNTFNLTFSQIFWDFLTDQYCKATTPHTLLYPYGDNPNAKKG